MGVSYLAGCGHFNDGKQLVEVVDDEIGVIGFELFAGIGARSHADDGTAGGVPAFFDVHFGIAYFEDAVGGYDTQITDQAFYHVRMRAPMWYFVTADGFVDQFAPVVPAQAVKYGVRNAAGEAGIERYFDAALLKGGKELLCIWHG